MGFVATRIWGAKRMLWCRYVVVNFPELIVNHLNEELLKNSLQSIWNIRELFILTKAARTFE